jgi:hypothetical protein
MWDARQLGQIRGRPIWRTIYSRVKRSRIKNIAGKLPESLTAGGADEIVNGA